MIFNLLFYGLQGYDTNVKFCITLLFGLVIYITACYFLPKYMDPYLRFIPYIAVTDYIISFFVYKLTDNSPKKDLNSVPFYYPPFQGKEKAQEDEKPKKKKEKLGEKQNGNNKIEEKVIEENSVQENKVNECIEVANNVVDEAVDEAPQYFNHDSYLANFVQHSGYNDFSNHDDTYIEDHLHLNNRPHVEIENEIGDDNFYGEEIGPQVRPGNDFLAEDEEILLNNDNSISMPSSTKHDFNGTKKYNQNNLAGATAMMKKLANKINMNDHEADRLMSEMQQLDEGNDNNISSHSVEIEEE